MHRKSLRILLQYFFQGLIILAPIAITVWAVVSLFQFIDGILPNLIGTLFPSLVTDQSTGISRKYPGLGFILVFILVVAVGYISSLFLFSRVVNYLDELLHKMPGISLVYTTIKDFIEAFAGNKKKFNQPVIVSLEAPDVWQMGFITQEDLTDLGLEEHVAVYIPHSYAFSGRLYFVKKERVKKVKDMTPAEAMKFAISGGVSREE
ncbi:MAG: DUF502 domain-containing protein [Sphingobacteriales bacterium]|jgi:uncharacterized membrane protein